MPAMTEAPTLTLRGVKLWQGALDRAEQAALAEALRGVARAAPMFHPETRWGKRMSVKMTSAGKFGWVSDRQGYRYEPRHPSGVDWPEIPAEALAIWARFAGAGLAAAGGNVGVAPTLREPECCLVNYYGEGARMGLHQDRDEADFAQPVVSVSLGDEGLFRVGNVERGGKTDSVWLRSGDVMVLGGAARLVHHGVDRIRFGSGTLLPGGGRINLTMRVVT